MLQSIFFYCCCIVYLFFCFSFIQRLTIPANCKIQGDDHRSISSYKCLTFLLRFLVVNWSCLAFLKLATLFFSFLFYSDILSYRIEKMNGKKTAVSTSYTFSIFSHKKFSILYKKFGQIYLLVSWLSPWQNRTQ